MGINYKMSGYIASVIQKKVEYKKLCAATWLIMVFVALSSCQSPKDNSKLQADNSESNKVLLISFDGFRYDYLNKTATPNFDQFAENGVQSKGLIPVFPSKTFPNHYSIATGLYPENTGFVGNTMYDPEWEEWYRIGDREAVENGKWYSGEPIWNTLEKQDIRTGTMFWVGSEADIQEMHPTHWKPYDQDMPKKARIDTVVKWMSAPNSEAIDFATLYFEQVDTQGHRYGTKSDSVNAAIQKSDRLVGYLRQQMQEQGLWDNTNIIILSDHGMTDLSADKVIRLDDIIDMDDVKRIINGPMTMIWPEEGQANQLIKKLKSGKDHYRVYKKENLPERYHLKNNRRIADIVMVADLGYTIIENKNVAQFKEYLPSGTHGYDNNEKKMQALFIARGPDFKTDTTVGTFQNIHVYDLINKLMGTEPAKNDGSLDSVRVLLKDNR